jgi:hypothetical protein
MAIEQHTFDALKTLAPCRLLSLGYPDLLLTEERASPIAADAQRVARLHNWGGAIYDTDAVFAELGIKAVYMDIRARTGKEEVGDLNESEMPWLPGGGGFDVILDPGTLEHCFNIGQAFINVRNLVRPGGAIIHTNPLTMLNHGFFNINPTAYYDWYRHHGDEIVMGKVTKAGMAIDTVPHDRFGVEEGCSNLIVVRRSDTVTLAGGWPVQWKYDKGRLRGEKRTDTTA